MATFRPLLKKRKASMKLGAGADEVFKPIWFAFEAMERFLGAVYDVESTINTEREPQETDEVELVSQDSQDMGENEEENEVAPLPPVQANEEERAQENPRAAMVREENTRPAIARPLKKKRTAGQAFDIETAQTQLNESFKTLNHAIQNKGKRDNLDDDCDLYGRLLATKLKRYPVSQRQRIMYRIDGLLLDILPETCRSTPPSSASRPTSVWTSQDSPINSSHSISPHSQHSQLSPHSQHLQHSQLSQHTQNSQHSLESQHLPYYSKKMQCSQSQSLQYSQLSQPSQYYPPNSQISLHTQVRQYPLQNIPMTLYSHHPSSAPSTQSSAFQMDEEIIQRALTEDN